MYANYDAFVMYSSKNCDWVVNVLVSHLESKENGYNICLHDRDFIPGSYIVDNIGQCIDQSNSLILVLTPDFIASEVRTVIPNFFFNI